MASVSDFERAAMPRFRDDGAGRDRHGAALAARELRAEVEPARALSRLIEGEIIPRLMVAHRFERGAGGTDDSAGKSANDTGSESTSARATGGTIDRAEVAAFAPLALSVEADALLDHVSAILARGVSVATVLIDLLAPAARRLGELWEDDRCDFVDVTMGLWRLQAVVREIAGVPVAGDGCAGGRRAGDGVAEARCALFASMPGDQHSFGSVLIDDLFCRAGWRTERMCEAARCEVLGRVAAGWFDLVGLTISCDCHIAALPSMIGALRTASRNPRLCVMVGGPVFGADAGAGQILAARVGADGTAPDARLAVEVAGKLVAAVRGSVHGTFPGAVHGEAALS